MDALLTYGALGLVLVAGVWWFLRRRRHGGPMISLVALLREPLKLGGAQLCVAVSRATGKPFEHIREGSDDDAALPDNAVLGEAPPYFVTVGGFGTGAMYNVLLFGESYFGDKAPLDEIPELRLREAVRQHTAWVSVDLVSQSDEKASVDEAYRFIGKVLAELIGDNCLALFCPQDHRAAPFDADVKTVLRSADPLAVFATPPQPPVLGVDENDAAMRAAVAEATRRFPEFVSAFQKRSPDQMFSVKVALGKGDTQEFIWVNVDTMQGDVIVGKLGNDPVHMPDVKEGHPVKIKHSQVTDWLFTEGDDMCGNFSLKAIAQAQEKH